MVGPGLPPRRVMAALLGIALVGGLGCAKKITSVDASFTTPEGKHSDQSILVLNRNLGNLGFFFQEFMPLSEREPAGPSPGDTLAEVRVALKGTAGGTEGVVEGLVFDSTQASGYQIFHRESNGGMQRLFDFDLLPKQRWLDTQWEKYSWVDQRIEADPTYQARGLVGGAASDASPLTNDATSPFDSFSQLEDIPVTFPEPLNDSVLIITWPAVPGAAGYFVHAYKFRADFNRSHSLEVTVAQGAPRPINDGQVNDALLVYLSGETQCGVGPAAGAHLLAGRGISKSAEQFVRVTAIDCSGRLIGFSFGDPVVVDLVPNAERLAYFVYFLGGYSFPRPRPPSSPLLLSRLRKAARFGASPETAERITYRIHYEE